MIPAKVKTIILIRSAVVNLEDFSSKLEALNISHDLDIKIISDVDFDVTPFGDCSEVQILGVNGGMPDLVNQILEANPSIK